jgi:MoxR-like ATPase
MSTYTGGSRPAPTAPTPATRTCLDCPAYTTPEVYALTTGKSIGAAYCRHREILLTVPAMMPTEADRKTALKSIASDCSEFGKPLESGRSLTDVALVRAAEWSDNDAFLLRTVDEYEDRHEESVSSCRSCAFFVSPRTMSETYGITGGLCKANNLIINPKAVVAYANTCAVKKFTGEEGELQADFEFGEWIRRAVGRIEDPYSESEALLTSPHDIIEPKDYETDAPVEPEEAAKGIRAWRRVADLSNDKRSVLLPVFDNAFFTEEEREKIPQTGDDEHPELYLDYSESLYKVAVLWMNLDETPAVWGEPGVGKTELFRHLAWMMQLPFERISVTATSEVDDLAGKMVFVDNETVFQYGRIPRAWTKPCVIVIDEPNVGPPEVWHFIRPLTDNSKQMVLDQNKGERILRHDHAFMGMAMNPAWDPRNVGTETVADADSSRLMHIFIDLPPADVEKKIIADRIALDGWKMAPKHLDQIMRVAADIRKLSRDGVIPITWGIRAQIKVARALKYFSPAEAYRIAAADFLEPEVQTALLDVVRMTVTGDIS